jgi:hypothetical protein
MKHILLIAVTIAVTFFCMELSAQSSQQQELDSLLKVVAQFEGEEKLNEYKRIIRQYIDGNRYTILFPLIDSWETEAHKQGDLEQQCESKYVKAVTFVRYRP